MDSTTTAIIKIEEENKKPIAYLAQENETLRELMMRACKIMEFSIYSTNHYHKITVVDNEVVLLTLVTD